MGRAGRKMIFRSGKMSRLGAKMGFRSGKMGRPATKMGRPATKMGFWSGKMGRLEAKMGRPATKMGGRSGKMGRPGTKMRFRSGKMGRPGTRMGFRSGRMGLWRGDGHPPGGRGPPCVEERAGADGPTWNGPTWRRSQAPRLGGPRGGRRGAGEADDERGPCLSPGRAGSGRAAAGCGPSSSRGARAAGGAAGGLPTKATARTTHLFPGRAWTPPARSQIPAVAPLDKYERQPDENPPLGLILCADENDEQIELLQLTEGSIRVASYLTELPPRALLEKKLTEAIAHARARFDAGPKAVGGGDDDSTGT
jgi:hypothetical protein